MPGVFRSGLAMVPVEAFLKHPSLLFLDPVAAIVR